MRFKKPQRTKVVSKSESLVVEPPQSHLGGAIRQPKLKNIKVDSRDKSFIKGFYNQFDDDDDSFADHEVSMYTHYGGRLSGYGARGDSPRTVRFMHNTFKQFPEVLAAYHSGKVANLSEETW